MDSQMEDALREFGVAIADSHGCARSARDIFDEAAAKFKYLSDVNRARLSDALMGNWPQGGDVSSNVQGIGAARVVPFVADETGCARAFPSASVTYESIPDYSPVVLSTHGKILAVSQWLQYDPRDTFTLEEATDAFVAADLDAAEPVEEARGRCRDVYAMAMYANEPRVLAALETWKHAFCERFAKWGGVLVRLESGVKALR